MKGKTIGLIGTGRIGLHATRVARGFGMQVLGYDPTPQTHLADLLGFEYSTLEDLLRRSQIISLHGRPINTV